LNYILFILYFLIACYFLPRIGFIKKAHLKNNSIRALLILKVAVGIFWGWLNIKYARGNSDVLSLNEFGWEEYKIMINDPKSFVTNLFYSGYGSYSSFFGSVGSYWNDLETNIILKFLAILNVFSQGNYFINSLFFNIFSIFGHIALYRIFIQIYTSKKLAVLIGSFLLPSTLLFTSGIGKDNVVFTLLCIFCYAVFMSMQNSLTLKKFLLAFLSFLGILLIRNYVAIALMPALLALAICHKTNLQPVKIFFTTYFVSLMAVAALAFMQPTLNPAKLIAQKQKDFLEIPVANSQIKTDTLLPDTKSLINNLPQAIDHGFLRPYIWESQNGFTLLLSLELLLYLFLFISFLIFSKNSFSHIPPFVLFGIFIAFSIIILNGYIVPNYNSLARYRSIYLPFLITPLLCRFSFFNERQLNINF
jgi:hypothetical protein